MALLMLALSGITGMAHAATTEVDASFDRGVTLLLKKGFSAHAKGIRQLVLSKDPRVAPILKAMLAGELYLRKKERDLVFAKREKRIYQITSALDNRSLGQVRKRVLRKVKVNNRLRRQLRAALAALDLRSPDRDVRLAAIGQMLVKPDADIIDLVKGLRAGEKDSEVAQRMDLLLAFNDLTAASVATRLQAVKRLSGSLQPSVRNALNARLKQESEPGVKKAIRQALHGIDSRVHFYAWLETLFFGLSLGSVLVLAAIGLAITFGVMGVINMAHGELIMLGAYTTYVVQKMMPGHIGLSLLLAVPAAFLISGLTGIVIERLIIRHLYNRPLETLLATFGVSLILQQAVRSIFSPLNRAVITPEWMSGSVVINGALSLTYNRLYVILFALLVFFTLFAVLKRTRLGLQVRAVSQNREMAKAMGVRSDWVDALTFGLGSGIAGVAGVALSQLTNVGPNLGQSYIIDSFMVVVFGGVGNLWGTLVGGLSLGVANKFMEPYAGAVMAKILILVFIILFIQKRPRGLFPQKGRAVEV